MSDWYKQYDTEGVNLKKGSVVAANTIVTRECRKWGKSY